MNTTATLITALSANTPVTEEYADIAMFGMALGFGNPPIANDDKDFNKALSGAMDNGLMDVLRTKGCCRNLREADKAMRDTRDW